MQTVGSANKNAPSIAEERAVAGTAGGAGCEVGNDDNIEFETLGLMNRKHANHFIEFRNDLGFRFTNRSVMSAIPQVAHDLIERRSALPRQTSRDLDQL